MRALVALSLAATVALAFAIGCGKCERGGQKDNSELQNATEVQDQDQEQETEKLEQDDDPLDVESAETPEGVVNSFFRAFFRGDSDAAFALLSKKAQEAQSENFVAQSSDSIRWRVVEKTKPTSRGRVYVWVEVEDYADNGEVQRDALSFALADDGGIWRISGFHVGEVAVDFEKSVIIAQEAPAAPGAERVERVASQVDETKTTR